MSFSGRLAAIGAARMQMTATHISATDRILFFISSSLYYIVFSLVYNAFVVFV